MDPYRHTHRRDEDDYGAPPPPFGVGGGGGGFRDDQPPPPPQFVGGGEMGYNPYNPSPPPPFDSSPGGYSPVRHVSHESNRFDSGPGPGYPPVHHVSHEPNRFDSAPDYPPVRHEPNRYDSGPAYPPVQHVSHESNRYDSAPGYPPVQHVSHESNRFDSGPGNYPPPGQPAYGNQEPPERTHESHHRPHLPSFMHHHSHESPSETPDNNQRTVRIYTKADPGYSLTIRDNQVILAPSDPSDDFQHWIKDERYSTKVKDKEGHPSFSLVNKATGQAIKHSYGAEKPVQLVPYKPNTFDESILWTESKDLGDSYRCIRMVNNILLNFDAFHGDKNHGGVRNGTVTVLWEWKTGDNQRWKIVPY